MGAHFLPSLLQLWCLLLLLLASMLLASVLLIDFWTCALRLNFYFDLPLRHCCKLTHLFGQSVSSRTFPARDRCSDFEAQHWLQHFPCRHSLHFDNSALRYLRFRRPYRFWFLLEMENRQFGQATNAYSFRVYHLQPLHFQKSFDSWHFPAAPVYSWILSALKYSYFEIASKWPFVNCYDFWKLMDALNSCPLLDVGNSSPVFHAELMNFIFDIARNSRFGLHYYQWILGFLD